VLCPTGGGCTTCGDHARPGENATWIELATRAGKDGAICTTTVAMHRSSSPTVVRTHPLFLLQYVVPIMATTILLRQRMGSDHSRGS
jgi:hypothetical protein